jgi:leucyl-tRNA synthetase
VMRFALESATQMLGPFVPHVAEEVWEMLGHEPSIFHTPWPLFDEAQAKADETEIPVQVNGKLRGKVVVPAGASEEEVRKAALDDEKTVKALEGKAVRKVIVIPGRLVNIVAG